MQVKRENLWEPVSGFEPLTCRLQEVRFVAICALTALMPHVIALMALAELGFSGGSSHDSSHAAKQQLSRSCNAALIQRLLTNPAPGRRRSGRILSPPTAWRAAAWRWTASRRPTVAQSQKVVRVKSAMTTGCRVQRKHWT